MSFANSADIFGRSRFRYFTWPSGKSCGSKPISFPNTWSHFLNQMQPGVPVGVAGIDLEDWRERGVVDAEAHGLIVGLDHVDMAFVLFFLPDGRAVRSGGVRLHRIRWVCELREPRPDRR